MFDKNIVVSNKTITKNTTINPENIELDITKDDVTSFFLEINRNSREYQQLLGDTPFITKQRWCNIEEGDHYHDRRTQLVGGYYVTDKFFVQIIRMVYVGDGNFLFELKYK